MSITIEAGKRYAITPKTKKSVEDIEFFQKEESRQMINVTTLWRGGDYYIIPEDDEEAKELQSCIDEGEIEITAFANWELGSTWDGISVDFSITNTDLSEEEQENLIEQLEEDYWTWLEENGYDSYDCEIYIYNGIEVEEMEEGYLDG